jgi:hypothetical protein
VKTTRADVSPISRREAFIAAGALAAIPLLRKLPSGDPAQLHFPTGLAEIDSALGGGMRQGSLLVVIGPRGSGKSDFLLRLAKTNGIADAHPINQGASDMLSIMQHHDGQHIGSIVLNGVEPSTDKERADMERDPQARDAFLTRWFRRSKEILRESGGIFALTISEPLATGTTTLTWMTLPDYIIQAESSTYRLIKST